MQWLENIKKSLFFRALHRAQPRKDQPYKMDLSVATVGILFDGTLGIDRVPVETLIRELRDNGHEVYPIGYIDNNSIATTYAFKHFYKKDISFRYIPKHPDIDKFLDKNYSILINLAIAENLPLHYIAKKTHAQFKVGPLLGDHQIYDLTIQPGRSEGTESLIEHIKRILKSIQYSNE